jgi:hypothetical protein
MQNDTQQNETHQNDTQQNDIQENVVIRQQIGMQFCTKPDFMRFSRMKLNKMSHCKMPLVQNDFGR